MKLVELEVRFIHEALTGGGQAQAMLDELALQSPHWRRIKYAAQRIAKPLPSLPPLASPLPLPATGGDAVYGNFESYESKIMVGMSA